MEAVVQTFVDAAAGFRAALVDDAAVERREYARVVRNAVARVYLAAALLGPPQALETDDLPDRVRDRRTPNPLEEKLRARFGDHDRFMEVFDAAGVDGIDQDAIESVLSHELAEIDDDLADAIAWHEQDAPDALWNIRFAFEHHWGRHAVDVLRPLHQLATYGVV